jgi:hypothetical protein
MGRGQAPSFFGCGPLYDPIMLDAGIEELRQAEADCVRKFRLRAELIRAVDPRLSREIAFARAVEELPKTAVRYQHVRARLGMAGVAALPLIK